MKTGVVRRLVQDVAASHRQHLQPQQWQVSQAAG